jgi:uncharacterized protein (TIGR03067 family)
MLRYGVIAILGLAGFFMPAPGAEPTPASAPVPGDLAALQGNWKPLSVQFEGKAQMTADEMKKITVVFDKSEFHLYYADKSTNPPRVLRLAQMNIALDPTTTPKSITFEFAEGPLKGQKRHGIYELAGNELKLCYGPIDKPKPSAFAAPEKSGYFLEVWAKQPVK